MVMAVTNAGTNSRHVFPVEILEAAGHEASDVKSAGAVAKAGTVAASGEKKTASRSRGRRRLPSPVRPPASTRCGALDIAVLS